MINSKMQLNHTLILVRESGRIELYMNFMLVEQYLDEDHPCTDVWCIRDGYILKFKDGDENSYK